VTDDEYMQWASDARVLAAIGRALFSQRLGINVRLPRDLADQAVASWEREEDSGTLPEESPEQRITRHRSATLSLIGLSIQSTGVEDDEEVAVELDAWFIGDALAAADDEGLLDGVYPPSRP